MPRGQDELVRFLLFKLLSTRDSFTRSCCYNLFELSKIISVFLFTKNEKKHTLYIYIYYYFVWTQCLWTYVPSLKIFFTKIILLKKNILHEISIYWEGLLNLIYINNFVRETRRSLIGCIILSCLYTMRRKNYIL